MLAPAPGRFSITAGCPSPSPIFVASTRPMRSVELPAENPTTIRTGLTGYACDSAAVGNRIASVSRMVVGVDLDMRASSLTGKLPEFGGPLHDGSRRARRARRKGVL